MEISQQKYQLQHMLISVTNPDKQPRKQARSEERQTTFLSTKMVTEKKIVEEIRYMTTTKK